MKFETLGYEVSEGVATITLNRPDMLNAFNETMANELAAAWKAVQSSSEKRRTGFPHATQYECSMDCR